MSLPTITLEEIVESIEPVDESILAQARQRTEDMVMPLRALGRLHDISERICAIQRTLRPEVKNKTVIIFAADHGVVEEGVSAYPQAVTKEMIRCFLLGGAGINALSRHVGAQVWIVDAGIASELELSQLQGADRLQVQKVGYGTENFTKGPAMSRQQAEKSIITGYIIARSQIEKGTQILAPGDMGIGNTTSSAAMGVALTGAAIKEMVGKGTGIDESGLEKKRRAVEKGLQINKANLGDSLGVLSSVGGFEIGAIAGCILAGASHRLPVVVDGFISTAGALLAHSLSPEVSDYLLAGHNSQEPGHRIMLQYLGLEPILDLGMRLGEGSGGVLSISIIEAAAQAFKEILTFEQAGVSKG